MKALKTFALAAGAMIASAGWAAAQEAITTADVNMRAGPGSRFPVVTTIPEGREVFIHGCLSDFDWCDVSWRRDRGWVFSDFLEGSYGQSYVPFYEYRRRTNLPVITFGFGYWDRHYRNRSWFDDWDRWDRRRDRNWNRDWDRDRDRDRDDEDRVRVRDRDRDDDDQVRVRDRDRVRDDDDGVNRRERRERRERLDCDGPNPDPRCGNVNENRRLRRDGNTENMEEDMMP